jgi:hypothetical protein
MAQETIFQVINANDFFLVSYDTSREGAKKIQEEYTEMFPEEEYIIVEGTDYIRDKCRGCGTVHAQERYDAHGITTGHWCQSCYDSSKYPYRKDRYATIETHGYGERLSDNY